MSDAARRVVVGVVLAAGAALTIAGCSATTGGTASPAARTAGCTGTGYSASAATATVRCYLDALRAGDTDTACEQLSVHARSEVLARAREAGLQGVISISTRSSGCATVATVIRQEFESLTPAQHAELEHGLRTARVDLAQVSGSTATVTVHAFAQTTRATLVRGPVTWRIDSSLQAD